MVGSLKDRIKKIQKEIQESAVGVGRDPSSVTLLAVSKRQPIEKIIEALKCGLVEFGENYVQELAEKRKTIQGCKWHLIGSIQSKKVKSVAGQVELIHTVDRLKLLTLLNEECARVGCRQKVLLQVNISGEASKSGFSPSEIFDVVAEYEKYPHLEIDGFMTMPPFTDHPEDSRSIFRELSEIQKKARLKVNQLEFPTLSMGTSQDFRVAIEEGSTIVRVGTAIFGERKS